MLETLMAEGVGISSGSSDHQGLLPLPQGGP